MRGAVGLEKCAGLVEDNAMATPLVLIYLIWWARVLV
jgi:hypothetical protein